MVSAVPLSSVVVSVDVAEDALVGPGAARTTLIAANDSNAKTIPPSRNRKGFFMRPPLGTKAWLRCCPENARPARTCSESWVARNHGVAEGYAVWPGGTA